MFGYFFHFKMQDFFFLRISLKSFIQSFLSFFIVLFVLRVSSVSILTSVFFFFKLFFSSLFFFFVLSLVMSVFRHNHFYAFCSLLLSSYFCCFFVSFHFNLILNSQINPLLSLLDVQRSRNATLSFLVIYC